MSTWNAEPATGAAREAVERRSEDRTETRFEVVWAVGTLDGEGALRNLSRSGAWIEAVSVPLLTGARIRVVILDREEEERDPVLVDGAVVRRTSAGFAVRFDPASSTEIGRLLDRLSATRSARRERRRRRRR